MDWHIDSVLNKAIPCNAEDCLLYSIEHHFANRQEAEEAIVMSQAIVFTPEAHELVFDLQLSALTGKPYLETLFMTTLGELAAITAEAKDGYALGTILIGDRIYGVSRTSSDEIDYLDKCARLALNIAVQDFSEELWPDSSVVALYKSINRYSSPLEIVAPGGLTLNESSQSGSPQLFTGTTAGGTIISISVAYGYAVAQADLKRSSKIIYESGIPSPIFKNTSERNRFAAKAFGELVRARV